MPLLWLFALNPSLLYLIMTIRSRGSSHPQKCGSLHWTPFRKQTHKEPQPSETAIKQKVLVGALN